MHEIPAPVAEALTEGEYYVALRFSENDCSGDDHSDCANYVHSVEGRIALLDMGGKLLDEIGEFSIWIVDTEGLVAQDVSIYQAYDVHAETFGYFEDLVDFDVQWDFKLPVLEALDCVGEVLASGMLIVSDLGIAPAYRGRDFGLIALKTIIQRFRMGMGIVAMRPFPLQYANLRPDVREELALDTFKGSERATLMKIRAHFGRLGFKLIPGTDVMALETIRPLENLELRWQEDE